MAAAWDSDWTAAATNSDSVVVETAVTRDSDPVVGAAAWDSDSAEVAAARESDPAEGAAAWDSDSAATAAAAWDSDSTAETWDSGSAAAACSSSAWDSDYRYQPRPLFEKTFKCLPFSTYKRPHLNLGDKIIMPASSLVEINSVRVNYPLTFQIESYNNDIISHCGVLEFDAEEGCVHMPEWMMKNLKLQEGDLVIIRNASLPKACYMKLQPHTTAFTELSDPRAVLERTLRDFTCLSSGDTIMVQHNDRNFYLDVLEVLPGGAVNLINTDCHVDFAPPLDYKEPETPLKDIQKVDDCGEENEEVKMFVPFTGKARRLDEIPATVETTVECSAVVEGMSKLVIDEGKKREKDGGKEKEKEKFKPFTGKSRVLGGVEF